jgi:15-cis-phytoene synthase
MNPHLRSMPDLSPLGSLVRRADPDRFLTALFAPAARREALFALYAFNVELARARDVASNPMLALIRLQWWREVVEGVAKAHEVATPLAGLLETGALDRGELLGMVDAREAEVDEIATLAEWRATLLGGAGGLAVAAGRLLGAPGQEGLRQLGAGYGAAGMLRSLPALAARGRCLLPADLMAAHGLSAEAVIAAPMQDGVRPVLLALAAEGKAFLAEGRRLGVPRAAVAAALPGVLARRDLRRPGDPAPRGLGDRLAVVAAGFLGV